MNHGIANSLIDAVKRAGKEFFQLPLEEKQKYAINPGDLQRAMARHSWCLDNKN